MALDGVSFCYDSHQSFLRMEETECQMKKQLQIIKLCQVPVPRDGTKC